MRVLQVIAAMGVGGAEGVVRDLSACLVERGVDVVVASAGGVLEESLHAAGAGTVRLPQAQRRRSAAVVSGIRLSATIRRMRPDVVLAHNVGATLVARIGLLAARSRTPLVSTFHGVAAADYPIAARILRRCSDVVVVVAAAIGDRLVDAGVRSDLVRQIPNGVSTPARHGRGEARRRLQLPSTAPIALCAARLTPQKRHDVLLDAWSRLPAEAVLLIAGEGEQRARIERAVAEGGLTGRVHVLGLRDDIDWLLAAADALVLSSDWEGMPLIVLEALALNLPVVATDVDGLRETCAGTSARLVPPRDPQALADALMDVFDHGAGQEQDIGSTDRTMDRSAGAMSGRYLSLFEQLADSGARPRRLPARVTTTGSADSERT